MGTSAEKDIIKELDKCRLVLNKKDVNNIKNKKKEE